MWLRRVWRKLLYLQLRKHVHLKYQQPECHNTEHYNLIELQTLLLLIAISYCALKMHILDSNLKPSSSLFLEQFGGSKLANVKRSSVSSHSLSACLTYMYQFYNSHSLSELLFFELTLGIFSYCRGLRDVPTFSQIGSSWLLLTVPDNQKKLLYKQLCNYWLYMRIRD